MSLSLISKSNLASDKYSSADGVAPVQHDDKFGIVLVSQGSFATSLHEGVEHVLGPQSNFVSLAFDQDIVFEDAISQVKQGIDRAACAGGTIILADIFGGTPCNAAMKFYEKGKVEVIAGINLPFALKLAKNRTRCSLAEALDAAHNAGHRYLISCGDHIGYAAVD